jgi:hypothetical protein
VKTLLAAIIAILLTACSGIETPKPDFEGASAYYEHGDEGPASAGGAIDLGEWSIAGAWNHTDGLAKFCVTTPWFVQMCGAVPITDPPTQGVK